MNYTATYTRTTDTSYRFAITHNTGDTTSGTGTLRSAEQLLDHIAKQVRKLRLAGYHVRTRGFGRLPG